MIYNPAILAISKCGLDSLFFSFLAGGCDNDGLGFTIGNGYSRVG
jgi:hypothetical protein